MGVSSAEGADAWQRRLTKNRTTNVAAKPAAASTAWTTGSKLACSALQTSPASHAATAGILLRVACRRLLVAPLISGPLRRPRAHACSGRRPGASGGHGRLFAALALDLEAVARMSVEREHGQRSRCPG